MLYLFHSRSSKLSQLSRRIAPSKSLQGFTWCFQLLFPSGWSLFCLTEFFMKVLHDGSSRFKFLLEVFINILFRGAQAFFILQSGVQFLLSYLLRWCYVILDNFPSCFMDHNFSKSDIFKSIIFSSLKSSFQPINFFEHELFSIHQSLCWSYIGLYFT